MMSTQPRILRSLNGQDEPHNSAQATLMRRAAAAVAVAGPADNDTRLTVPRQQDAQPARVEVETVGLRQAGERGLLEQPSRRTLRAIETFLALASLL